MCSFIYSLSAPCLLLFPCQKIQCWKSAWSCDPFKKKSSLYLSNSLDMHWQKCNNCCGHNSSILKLKFTHLFINFYCYFFIRVFFVCSGLWNCWFYCVWTTRKRRCVESLEEDDSNKKDQLDKQKLIIIAMKSKIDLVKKEIKEIENNSLTLRYCSTVRESNRRVMTTWAYSVNKHEPIN